MSSLDVASVSQELRGEHINWTLEHREVCDSTQDLARAALQQGAMAGTVIVTDWQRKGRGRYGRPWTAPPGRALLFSTILIPPSGLIGALPLLAGVAVSDGIETLTGVQCDLKWPNDVLAAESKLAGILAERPSGPAVVLGVGVNVNLAQADLPAQAAAISLLVLIGREVSRERLLASILNSLDAWYGRAIEEGTQAIIAAWRQRASMLGHPVEVTQNGSVRLGVAEDIDEAGGLILRYDDGRRETFLAGEVRRLRTR